MGDSGAALLNIGAGAGSNFGKLGAE
jgi:hypothetical protein